MDHFTSLGSSSLKYRLVNNIIISTILALLFGGLPLFFCVMASGTVMPLVLYPFLGEYILFLLMAVWFAYLDYNHAKYKVDDKTITLQEGRFSVETVIIPYFKVQNAAYNQSLLQRTFNVGNISIQQEVGYMDWKHVDAKNANKILSEINSKSNVLPIHK